MYFSYLAAYKRQKIHNNQPKATPRDTPLRQYGVAFDCFKSYVFAKQIYLSKYSNTLWAVRASSSM